MPEDLIGLAAWLHRQARTCWTTAEAATDPDVAALALADADLFQRASDIVKATADERRKGRALVVHLDPPVRSQAVRRERRSQA